ncbi:hypothetical protein [Nonomuraea sp. NPDC050786]|uniref:hypothetical protein n=1 Tax=Nonomuraea sp. NPDC050786 TaxID=3154840 RepID=UPI0033F9346F
MPGVKNDDLAPEAATGEPAAEFRVQAPAMRALVEGPHGFALYEPIPSLAGGERYLTLYRQRAGGWVWLGSLIAAAEDVDVLLEMWEGAGGRVVTAEEIPAQK